MFCNILKYNNNTFDFFRLIKVRRKTGIDKFLAHRECILKLDSHSVFDISALVIQFQIIFSCKHIQIEIQLVYFKHLSGDRIGMGYISALVKGNNSVGHIMEYGLKLILFPESLSNGFIKLRRHIVKALRQLSYLVFRIHLNGLFQVTFGKYLGLNRKLVYRSRKGLGKDIGHKHSQYEGKEHSHNNCPCGLGKTFLH